MLIASRIGDELPCFTSDHCTSATDALILKRMVARYGLALVIGEMASVVGDMAEDCSGRSMQRLLATKKRLFWLALRAERVMVRPRRTYRPKPCKQRCEQP